MVYTRVVRILWLTCSLARWVEITPLTKFVGMFLTESAQIGDLCVIKVA